MEVFFWGLLVICLIVGNVALIQWIIAERCKANDEETYSKVTEYLLKREELFKKDIKYLEDRLDDANYKRIEQMNRIISLEQRCKMIEKMNEGAWKLCDHRFALLTDSKYRKECGVKLK